MIRSMTGFARVEAQTELGRLIWELRTVNHRYLDVSLRLPDELRGVENDARQQASGRVSRGKLEATLRFTRQASAEAPIEVDPQRLQQLEDALERVAAAVPGCAAPDPMRLLAWPGVVRGESPDLGPVQAVALSLLAQGLDELEETRGREGARMQEHIVTRCDSIESTVADVQAKLPGVQAQWLERVRARCTDLGVEVDPGRLEQEAVMAAQRLDVDEELSRLLTHVGEVRQVLKRKEAVGRRLDFLMQELNREANTLSSKSQDGDITRQAVELKVLIEQMREQVQNIE